MRVYRSVVNAGYSGWSQSMAADRIVRRCAPSRNNAQTAQSVPDGLARRESVYRHFLTFPHSAS